MGWKTPGVAPRSPDLDAVERSEFTAIVEACGWLEELLELLAARPQVELWLAAGTLRDVVWDTKFGDGFDPGRVRDVDIVYFDPAIEGLESDDQIEAELRREHPDIPWDVKNQATVHLWYPDRFGVTVPPLQSIEDAAATWPEFAVCIAVRRDREGELEIVAPHGLGDLLEGVWRRNPRRATVEEYERRLARKDPATRWPEVIVEDATM